MTTASGHTSVICASKVIGTNVKDPSGRTIGEVEDVVLDKQSNSILFAIVGFGGFLGMAEKYHPLPWASMTYDEDRLAREPLRRAISANSFTIHARETGRTKVVLEPP